MMQYYHPEKRAVSRSFDIHERELEVSKVGAIEDKIQDLIRLAARYWKECAHADTSNALIDIIGHLEDTPAAKLLEDPDLEELYQCR